MKVPTTVIVQPDGSTKAVASRQGTTHVERFTPAVCANPATLSDALTRMQKAAVDVGRTANGNPFAACLVLRGLTAGTAGAKLIVQHNLGRAAQWFVCGWRGAATVTAFQLVEDALDTSPLTTANTLALRSYTAGEVDLVIF